MSVIYILAGPPGVGKSINGSEFVPADLEIINQDDILLKYKAEGYTDYNQISAFKTDQIIKRNLIKDTDFILEINLGFPNQWKYVRSIKQFSKENQLRILLLFTDSLDLCLTRAKKRHENGLHLVEPETIKTMYNQTIPLLKENFEVIDNVVFIDVDEVKGLNAIGTYNKAKQKLIVLDNPPAWFSAQLYPFLKTQSE